MIVVLIHRSDISVEDIVSKVGCPCVKNLGEMSH